MDTLLNGVLLFVILLIVKRACIGPQMHFARTSGVLTIAGAGGFWLSMPDKESALFNVSAFTFGAGITVIVLMFASENLWMLKKLFASRKIK